MATVTTPAGDELEVTSPAELHYYRREPGYLIDGVDHTETDPETGDPLYDMHTGERIDGEVPVVDDVEVIETSDDVDEQLDGSDTGDGESRAWGQSD